MDSEGSVTHWIHEIKSGNPTAAQELWERYFQRLVQLSRQQLRGADRRVADEEDVAVSVFDNFCRAAQGGRFPNLADRDSLWRLLVRMAANKAVDLRRYHARNRRGGGGVRGDSPRSNTRIPDDPLEIAQIVGDVPTPEFSAILAEEIQRLMELLRDDQLRDLAVGKMEGYTNEEMAQRLGCSLRTVERRLRLIRVKCTDEPLGG